MAAAKDLSDPTTADATTAQNERAIKQVVFGNLVFDTWFDSLYPVDIVPRETETLYVCAWCFRYHPQRDVYLRHTECCAHLAQPPGVKVYDDGRYSVWQVDGRRGTLLAQNLSLFAKLFLDHKSVFFNVAAFEYFLLVYRGDGIENGNVNDNEHIPRNSNYAILGYFSKEKLSWDPNNLACILIFPPYQRRQLGKLLMGISYKLSFWEYEGGMIGGPERPLSEMGYKSYLRFWDERLARFLLLGATTTAPLQGRKETHPDRENNQPQVMKPGGDEIITMTVGQIGRATGMLPEDVLTALKDMGILNPAPSTALHQDEKKQNKAGETTEPETDHTASQDRRENNSDIDDDDENEINRLRDGKTLEDVDGAQIVSKSKVLEWAIAHRVSLVDPVKSDAFINHLVHDADPNSIGERSGRETTTTTAATTTTTS